MIVRKRNGHFDPKSFLAKIGEGRSIARYSPGQNIFAQGDPADAVFFVQKGKVKITILSAAGKEAVLAILGLDEFFGEGSLNGQLTHLTTAAALTDCSIMRIKKAAMIEALSTESKFSEYFIAFLLHRSARVQEDLVDHLFNSSEKRLARILLLLANFGKDDPPEHVVPHISQETLAEMVGTTRSRVNSFMNKFRRLGFIHYDGGLHNGGLQVHSSLLNVILHD